MIERNVKSITEYVLPVVNSFRQFPSTESEAVEKLGVIFDINSAFLPIVVKDGKFAESFRRKMGRGRMKALKKLLNSVNENYYETIDFGVD